MQAVKRVPVTEQVVDSLKEYITSGNVSVGDKMPTEMELCAMLNVGRGTVREATRVLLRRVPWRVIVNERHAASPELRHIRELCQEKNVPCEISRTDLGNYKVCGIIKNLSDI